METTEQAWSLPSQGIKRKILEVLATAGGKAPGETVRRVLDYQGKNWRYFMADLVNRGLLERQSSNESETTFSFVSEEIQEAVVARMTEEEMESVRQAIEEAKEAPGEEEEPHEEPAPAPEVEDSPPDEGRSPRRERAKARTGKESGPELLRMTADSLRRGDIRRTLEWCSIGIAGDTADSNEELVNRFRLLAARASVRSGAYASAQEYSDPVIADESAPIEIRAAAAAVDGDAAMQSGDMARARERLEWVADQKVGRDECALLHRALLESGLALADDRPSETLGVLDAVGFAPNDPMDRAYLSCLRGRALFVLREYEQCIQPLQEALDIFRNRGVVNAEFSVALLLSRAFHSRAQFAKSDSMLDVADKLAGKLADDGLGKTGKQELSIARGLIFADRGDVDRLGDAVTQMEADGSSENPLVSILGARLSAMKGYPGAAIDEYGALAVGESASRISTEALRETGHCYRVMGRVDDAISVLQDALRDAAELRDREEFAKAGIELVLAYLDRGLGKDTTRALVVAKKSIRLLEFVDAPDLTWRAHHALGRIYVGQKQHSRAFVRIGQATEILDQLLGRFQSRRDREEFLVGRYEVYRDWIVAFLEERSYKVPLDMLRRANYPEFVDFLRTNSDEDADEGPRYNEIGRLSQSFFDLYEKTRPIMPEVEADEREALATLRRAAKVIAAADAPAIIGELLGEGIALLGARMGAAGLVNDEGKLLYFKGRNLPGRKKSDTEPIRALVREVAETDREALLDGNHRLNGPGDPVATGYPLVGSEKVRGAVVFWYPKEGAPAHRKVQFMRAIVELAQVSITRTLALARQEDGPAPVAQAAGGGVADESAADVVLEGDESLKGYLERTERDLLSRAIERHAGDIPSVAKALGFTASNLKKKLGRFGLGG